MFGIERAIGRVTLLSGLATASVGLACGVHAGSSGCGASDAVPASGASSSCCGEVVGPEVAAALSGPGVTASACERASLDGEAEGDLDGYTETVGRFIAAQTFRALSPEQRALVTTTIDRHLAGHSSPLAMCFGPETDNRVIDAFYQMFDSLDPGRFQGGFRWSGAVASGSSGSFGEPITLTYSFVPDGTFIPDVGADSDLFAFLDGIYGSTQDWQDIYHRMFDAWGEATGITFVFEPNDDGANFPDAGGVLGVRGDLRMAGGPIDGNSGVLAFNYFPNVGDMVIDTADNFYLNTTNNSQRLFNVLKHEHGHGMGQAHVCPIEQTKLMEPFISTNFTGAQHDDIRGAHNMYGDFYESNDSIADAFDLGLLDEGDALDLGEVPSSNFAFESRLSIGDTGDVDYFRFEVPDARTLSLLVAPVGLNYQDNPQACGGVGNCCSGTFVDSFNQADLVVEVFNASGVLIASADATGLGGSESLVQVELPVGGEYFLKFSAAGSVPEVQLYSADVAIGGPLFLGPLIQVDGGLPSQLDPGVPADLSVTIDARQDVLVPGSAELSFRDGSGSFTSVSLTPTGVAGEFEATIPAFLCGSEPQFFVSVEGQTAGLVTVPAGGASAPAEAIVGDLDFPADLDFEQDPGWTVSSTASTGAWDRGVPIDDGRGDPPSDADGSGQAWVTGNSFEEDVDNGSTTLTTTEYDVRGGAVVRYSYWLNDIASGDLGPEDFLRFEVAFEPGVWFTLREYGTAAGVWRTDEIEIPAAPATETTRFRVIVADNSPGDVVEGGFDAFQIERLVCEDPVADPCPTDLDGDGLTDLDDLLAVLGAFGTSGPGVPDTNDDDATDLNDLLDVLSAFGEPCP